MAQGWNLHYLANPARFLRLSNRIEPWVAGLTVILLGGGLYLGLLASPKDYQQSEAVRIMYIHVPSAWMALFCYSSLAITSAFSLIWRHPLADIIGKSTAPIGACFTFLTLVTGSLWGKPMWGTWWVWDARLTSVLILFFLYLGYIALYNAFDDFSRGARAAAVLGLVGAVNLPIIKFSVDWWNTLHQPASVIKLGGPAIHPSMLWPLALMALAFTAYYVWVLLLRVRGELISRRISTIRHRQTHG
jgi:heme exporter protein C